MTLLARDEEDILDAQLAFHLAAGVDLVIATDHCSRDGTTDILERYAREGHVHLIREPDEEFRESEYMTRMARLAAVEHKADWVVNSCADEFWWPRGGDLKEVLAAIPARYGIVQAFVRHFPPRPDDAAFFAERMTVRLGPDAPMGSMESPFRAYPKVLHRGADDVIVDRGSHGLSSNSLLALRGWHPIEVLHFPIRSRSQYAHRVKLQTEVHALTARGHGAAYHALAHDASLEGRLHEHLEPLIVTDDVLDLGLEAGTLAFDLRVRDALRTIAGCPEGLPPIATFAVSGEGSSALRFPRPSVVDDAAYAVDAAVLGEADAVRAQRHLGNLEARVASLERNPGPRAVRLAGRTARRLARRGPTERSP